MPPTSTLTKAKDAIVQYFENSKQKVFRRLEVERILFDNSKTWKLAESTTTNQFLKFLVTQTDMREERIAFSYRPVLRYTWDKVETLPIVQSINNEGYFSHYSAIQFHGLTEQLPKSIYFNQEQSERGGGGILSQPGIDSAFRRRCRVTNNTAPFRNNSVFLLNGRNTGRLGVTPSITSSGEQIYVTSVERTLIDIVVRPVYSGGPFEVAKAFSRAHGMFSTNKLVSMLKELEFTYPYHQCIGFFMDRSGLYKESQLNLLRDLPIEFDFYADYALKSPDYNAKWRLFIPKGF